MAAQAIGGFPASGAGGTARAAHTCIACGYDLRGLRVEDRCPECGRAVWDSASPGRSTGIADTALALGTASVVLVFLIGPLAMLCAVPAVLLGRRAKARLLAGEIPVSAAANIRGGLVCGWIGLALSSLVLCAYAVMLVNVL